ncbi:hypothetical protein P168DRAFT_287657 [Aspergillus campestris IBT 28561]|uniref:Uncharacterized protein n=1 Tax=Aspergillus campestris (strain IBT 28561) TaxID=1392248 RepID=A0A2I1DBC7_ASPC2|nr:uncharacterized protein P168DRAFT_287657 [Aspergillus campestris IBT 28561]PKY07160.1 hypothetical protein P168DRAFT_287657 [Aspergillus campestris IBT 28561]
MKNQQLPEPPKQAAYNQPSNPVSHTPAEQRILSTHQQQPQSSQFTRQGGKVTRHAGDIVIDTAKDTSHRPSSSSSPYTTASSANTNADIKNDMNIGYGVEQQPNEGYIAHAVEDNSRYNNNNINNIKDDSPREHLEGCDGYDEEDDLMAHMSRKRREHDRVLRERMEGSSPGADVGCVEREALRRRKLEEERLDVVGAVRRGTGSPVV